MPFYDFLKGRIYKCFSERLREMRTLRGMTQKAVAEHLGINENAYQNYEYGKREPNYQTLVRLCRLLNESADYLIGVVVVE